MERMDDMPVLHSLVGHAVHRCGHILLVRENAAREWSVRWLGYLAAERRPAITCVPLQ
jgi:hypothetical protein